MHIKPMLKNCDIGSLEQGGFVAAFGHLCMSGPQQDSPKPRVTADCPLHAGVSEFDPALPTPGRGVLEGK